MRARSYSVCVTEQTPGKTVRLRTDEFDRLTAERGLTSDYKRSRAAGLSHSTLSRVRRGEQQPGRVFIAAVTGLLGVPFERLFEVA